MTKEEALNVITAFVENYACGSDLEGLRDAIEALRERPHGEWIEGIYGYHYCSKCHNYALADDKEEVLSEFCPNCGADMRKEGDGE